MSNYPLVSSKWKIMILPRISTTIWPISARASQSICILYFFYFQLFSFCLSCEISNNSLLVLSFSFVLLFVFGSNPLGASTIISVFYICLILSSPFLHSLCFSSFFSHYDTICKHPDEPQTDAASPDWKCTRGTTVYEYWNNKDGCETQPFIINL